MSAPWMPLYVADYLADTSHLSTLEHGAYMLLIMHYWRQGALPNDDKVLARIVRLSDREWRAIRATVAEFFSDDWTHERIEKELEKSREKSSRRAEAGSRGGNAKALKSKESAVANANSLLSKGDAFALASSSQPQSDTESTDSVSRASRKAAGKPARQKARKGMPPEQQPHACDRDAAHDAGMNGDQFRNEWRQWRDHHIAKGTLIADLHASWRTWCGNFKTGRFGARAGPPKVSALVAAAFPERFGDDGGQEFGYDLGQFEGACDSTDDPNTRVVGFAGRLPERPREYTGGQLVDLGQEDADRTG